MSAGRTPVYYFVPEDGDEEDHPNFFTIGRAANKIRLGDIKKTFPLPGAYHFRFKKTFKNTFVWQDVQDDYEVVPKFEGQVACKVSRLRASHNVPASSTQRASSGVPASTGSSQSAAAIKPTSTVPTLAPQGSNKRTDLQQKSSSGDLLGLGAPQIPSSLGLDSSKAVPGSEFHSMSSGFSNVNLGGSTFAQQSQSDNSKMMDLDWSSIPSPSPSPPPPIAGPGMRNGGMNSMNTQGRSTSPSKKLQPPGAKQVVQIPTDLSSAAKDFRL